MYFDILSRPKPDLIPGILSNTRPDPTLHPTKLQHRAVKAHYMLYFWAPYDPSSLNRIETVSPSLVPQPTCCWKWLFQSHLHLWWYFHIQTTKEKEIWHSNVLGAWSPRSSHDQLHLLLCGSEKHLRLPQQMMRQVKEQDNKTSMKTQNLLRDWHSLALLPYFWNLWNKPNCK